MVNEDLLMVGVAAMVLGVVTFAYQPVGTVVSGAYNFIAATLTADYTFTATESGLLLFAMGALATLASSASS